MNLSLFQIIFTPLNELNMYHIVFKTQELQLPTGINIQANNAIEALNTFSVTHPYSQFIVMYKVNQCTGGLEW